MGINYQEELKKESRKYHRGADKVNYLELAKKLPKVRKDYGRRIG